MAAFPGAHRVALDGTMAEIFISYATEDREAAKDLAAALEQRGWSVWWDRKIPLGQAFDKVIEEAIGAARCLIVLWSRFSVASEWVRSEASEGKRRGILVPAFLEAVDAPLVFRLLNGANLAGWEPGTSHPEFDKLTERITEILGQGASSGQAPVSTPLSAYVARSPSGRLVRLPLLGAIAVLLLVGLVFGAYILGRRTDRPPAKPTTTTSDSRPQPPGNTPVSAPISEASSLENALGDLIQGTGGSVNPETLGMKVFHVPDLGVHIMFIPPAQAQILGGSGAVVWRVEPGTGQVAGLQAGDVVAAVNGQKIESEDDLRRVLKGIGPGVSRYLIRRGENTLALEINCPTCTSSERAAR